MVDFERLRRDLSGRAPDDWIASVTDLCSIRLADKAHGNLPGWREALNSLPNVGEQPFSLDSPCISGQFDWPHDALQLARESLEKLIPWRKGPFDIGGIHIDSEWRCDLKWQRVGDSIEPLAGRTILDVGCGNGYYALRMRGQGAKLVLGVDPTVLFVVQFAAITHFMRQEPVHVLPLRLQELPAPVPEFDTTFSMGVLYHQREPLEHLAQLRRTLRAGGELVLETLIVPGEASAVVVPADRYARMRNVWHLPTQLRLFEWLSESGFTRIRSIDQTLTTVAEQRSTQWMPGESLRGALDPADPRKTIEGLPAPLRIVVTCKKPAC